MTNLWLDSDTQIGCGSGVKLNDTISVSDQFLTPNSTVIVDKAIDRLQFFLLALCTRKIGEIVCRIPKVLK